MTYSAQGIYELKTGWSVKETAGTHVRQWIKVNSVPTNIHLDLLDNKLIPNPFLDLNELSVQWINETSWTYAVSLPSLQPLSPSSKLRAELAFEGLDTFATVTLDGKVLLKSDNMFHSHRVDVSRMLGKDEGRLEITFDSAYKRARRIKDANDSHKWVGFNGDMARLAVRKAQYHWGWDWGPVLCPCGPWRPVRLEVFESRIVDVRVEYTLNQDLTKVSGKCIVSVDGPASSVFIRLRHDSQDLLAHSYSVDSDTKTATLKFDIDGVALWHPWQYGAQSLYEFRVSLDHDDEKSVLSKKIGFRSIKLVQSKDKIGKSFYFRVNGYDVYCGGTNWIPADSFTPRIEHDRYRRWLQMVVDGNFSMIRIWGGGIYEEDVFFNTCDELGILVWHDFMFGCGNYPTFPDILKSIEREVEQNLVRLRHHACLAVFAGNNEDYQVQESFGLTYDYADKDPQSWLKTDFPARYIYEKLLPDAMAKHAPHIAYHPGSPWGDGLKTSDPTVGDMHQWNVWHGTQEKYQIFASLGGRFNSEFGMEAFPHIGTIKAFCTDEKQLYAQSRTLDFHNKADHHERRIATYLVENFRTVASGNLEAHIHLTQLVQAEALMFGYRGWRRQWGQHRKCGGALVWQLDDCWPGTSWSIVDYYLRKKPAYYAMRRTLAKIAVGVEREHWDWSVVHARPPAGLGWECWVANGTVDEVDATIVVRFVSIANGKEVRSEIVKKMTLVANGTTEAVKGTIDEQAEEPHVIAATVYVDDKLVSRDTDWPQPLKYLDFADRGVEVKKQYNKNGGLTQMIFSAKRPTKGLVLEEREGVLVDDSAIDLVPGDTQTVNIKGLLNGDEALAYRYPGQDD